MFLVENVFSLLYKYVYLAQHSSLLFLKNAAYAVHYPQKVNKFLHISIFWSKFRLIRSIFINTAEFINEVSIFSYKTNTAATFYQLCFDRTRCQIFDSPESWTCKSWTQISGNWYVHAYYKWSFWFCLNWRFMSTDNTCTCCVLNS